MRGDQEMVEILVEQGCDPLVCSDNRSLLPHLCAALQNQRSLLDWLLNRFSIPVDMEDRQGYSALAYAAGAGHMDLVQWLIGKGADPWQRNGYKWQRPSQ